jgi:hypothetical protein
VTVAGAVVAKLEAWAAAQPYLVSVYFVQVPGIPPVDQQSGAGRYVVVFPISEVWSSSAIDAVSSGVVATVQVTSAVWLTEDFSSPAPEAEFLQAAVKSQLLDWAPVVDGLLTSPFRHTHAGNLRSDEAIADRQVIYTFDQFSLTAQRIL